MIEWIRCAEVPTDVTPQDMADKGIYKMWVDGKREMLNHKALSAEHKIHVKSFTFRQFILIVVVFITWYIIHDGITNGIYFPVYTYHPAYVFIAFQWKQNFEIKDLITETVLFLGLKPRVEHLQVNNRWKITPK